MNRDEWLRWRKKGIGASDASAILGISKFKDARHIYEDKISDEIDEDMNFPSSLGQKAEALIREHFNLSTGKECEPELFVHPDISFFRCSLDGYDKTENIGLEIKLLEEKVWEALFQGMPLKEASPQYYAQVQHQLYVTRASKIWFVAHEYYPFRTRLKKKNKIDSKDIVSVLIEPDPPYVKDLINKESFFWNECVLKKTPPTKENFKFLPPKPVDMAMSYDQMLIDKYILLKKQASKIKGQLDAIEESLKEFAEESKNEKITLNEKVTLIKVNKKGNIDYKSIKEIKDVDLEKYRKQGGSYWRITIKEDSD